ncbi:CapA family protein [Spirochaeta thermophila]|nr:CapA family protein [Spirochaeta thermophila]
MERREGSGSWMGAVLLLVLVSGGCSGGVGGSSGTALPVGEMLREEVVSRLRPPEGVEVRVTPGEGVPEGRLLWKPVASLLYGVPVRLETALTESLPEGEAWGRAVRLEEIVLPHLAARVEGRYPGEKGYPLEVRVWVGVRADLLADTGVRAWWERVGFEADGVSWVGVVGDVGPFGALGEVLAGPGGAQRVAGEVWEALRGVEVLLGNLEGAVTSRTGAYPKPYIFRIPEGALRGLRELGFDWLSLANNHSWDFFEPGFLDTLRALARVGLATSGAGRSLEEAQVWWRVRLREGWVGVLGVGAYLREDSGFDGEAFAAARPGKPGILWADERLWGAMEGEREGLRLLMVHGGLEYTDAPREDFVRLYRTMVDHGADVVIGAHPHVLQGGETYKKGIIFYSLGNFLFPDDVDDPRAFRSVLLRLGIHKGEVRILSPLPVVFESGRLWIGEGGIIHALIGAPPR